MLHMITLILYVLEAWNSFEFCPKSELSILFIPHNYQRVPIRVVSPSRGETSAYFHTPRLTSAIRRNKCLFPYPKTHLSSWEEQVPISIPQGSPQQLGGTITYFYTPRLTSAVGMNNYLFLYPRAHLMIGILIVKSIDYF